MTDAAVGRGGGEPGRQGRRQLRRLRRLAERLDQQACLVRNGGFNCQAEAQAAGLAEDAFALRWALRRLDPELETVRQVFGALAGPARQGPR